MTTTLRVSPTTAVVPVHAAWDAAAGLVGGIGFGIWMSVSRPVADTAMITMVAGLLGSTNAFVGRLVHLAIALFAGIGFGILLGTFAQKLAPAIVLGVAYGAVWWALGALWIMPANMPYCLAEGADALAALLGQRTAAMGSGATRGDPPVRAAALEPGEGDRRRNYLRCACTTPPAHLSATRSSRSSRSPGGSSSPASSRSGGIQLGAQDNFKKISSSVRLHGSRSA